MSAFTIDISWHVSRHTWILVNAQNDHQIMGISYVKQKSEYSFTPEKKNCTFEKGKGACQWFYLGVCIWVFKQIICSPNNITNICIWLLSNWTLLLCQKERWQGHLKVVLLHVWNHNIRNKHLIRLQTWQVNRTEIK